MQNVEQEARQRDRQMSRQTPVKWRKPKSEPAWRKPKGAEPALAQAVAQVQVDAADALALAVVLQHSLLSNNTGSF